MDILLLETLIPQARQWLEARHTVSYQPQLAEDPSALRRAVYKTQALLVTPKVTISRELLGFAPRLKVIGCLFASTENIEMEACRERGIRVILPATAHVRAHAEYLLGGLLMLLRRGFGASLGGSRRADIRLGRELGDSVVGILGLTPVAHALAQMLAPLGATLIGYEPTVHRSAPIWQRLRIRPVGLAELMAQADAVSLQMPHASRYAGFINEAVLASCKPGQAWVSISRAELFEPQALANALKDGRIDVCMLDGARQSLVSEGSPLHGLSNLIVTPRVAAYTHESRLRANWYLVDRIHESSLDAPAAPGAGAPSHGRAPGAAQASPALRPGAPAGPELSPVSP